MAPTYISNLINVRKHARYSLRSINTGTLYFIAPRRENEKVFWWQIF